MAEGDTILRIANAIDDALGGETLTATAFDPRGAAVARRLDGMRLDSARAHGKNLLFEFGDVVLHSHLAMGGSWQLHPHGAKWRKPRRAAWLVLSGKDLEAVQFGGPTLRLLRTGSVRHDPVLRRLGPDILAPEVDLDDMTDRLRSQGDRAVGEVLLDQALIAGIGNIFKSEACFAAGIDPWRPAAGLAGDELAALLQTARHLMQEAVASGRQPNAVYRNAGRPCPRCRTPIAAGGQGDANRTTYWCPNCQR